MDRNPPRARNLILHVEITLRDNILDGRWMRLMAMVDLAENGIEGYAADERPDADVGGLYGDNEITRAGLSEAHHCADGACHDGSPEETLECRLHRAPAEAHQSLAPSGNCGFPYASLIAL